MDIVEKITLSQRKILDGLVALEQEISGLYTEYADRFPALRQQWEQLAREEQGHARQLESLSSFLDRGSLFHDIGKFNEKALAPVMEQISAARKALAGGQVTQKEAIKNALLIETSLVDAHFYQTVKNAAPEFATVARRLQSDTQRHVERIHQLLMTT